ncbi:cupin domain-containing protein [Rhodococcus sp. T2V]|uniref:cupin domain-containing protein n=1 Tax=Rhodococcus sp. T2V TaxID=3034164 RepID=UPI0023E09E90|nr:cupin domain-containing protein [Rhodococcus sp. T2V]MDF3310626.1 cupin domain-containing protein [Rhodococcus sp. T2V]
MDFRSNDGPTVSEHAGTCTTRFYIEKEELRGETMGGYLELFSRFRLEPGTRLEPHAHDSDELYYLLSGRAQMQVGEETTQLAPGDLVRIPPNAVHSIWPVGDGAIDALAIGFSYMPEDRIGYTAYPIGGDPYWVPHEKHRAPDPIPPQ